ncbi:hypothetical protein [Caulobacter segnis]|uniref:Uncharacterized protein n=1 Tax=Caulobacter segnis TaxID=88688 RepID=A0A2W5VFP3_9CAUL|nr:hypothetical protein [Caulobacter segnis]PZR34165.1 MAG: hypothetical protein DI526_11270 [Caulobacter segnis]
MASRLFSGLLGLALVVAAPTLAAETVRPPIRAFDTRTLEQLGATIYRQDRAAWLASDALTAKIKDPAKEKIIGWVVEGHGDAETVRFVRDAGQGPELAFDVEVTAKGAGKPTAPSDRVLSEPARAAFAARMTAARIAPRPCAGTFNSVVAKDPTSDGWLVWLLSPSPTRGAVPVGGHYRFSISADGQTVKQVDALSASCLTLQPPPANAGGAGLVASHVVSPTPVETHVFLSLAYRQPLYIVTGDQFWPVQEGRIGAPSPIKRQSP